MEPIGRDQSSSQGGRPPLGYDPIAAHHIEARCFIRALKNPLRRGAFVTRMLPGPMPLRIRSPESSMDWSSKKTDARRDGPQYGICQPRSLADRTPITGLWVDAGKVQVGDDPVRTIIGVNIVHGHFDTRPLPAAGGLQRQIALVNNL